MNYIVKITKKTKDGDLEISMNVDGDDLSTEQLKRILMDTAEELL